MVKSKAKIFLARERGLNETTWFRSQTTFNFGSYQQDHKRPFGNLYILNDDILDGGRSLGMTAEEFSYVILLPVMGAISFFDSRGNEGLLAAGQVQFLVLDKKESLRITNPFEEELVNFIQLWIRGTKQPEDCAAVLSTFDINKFQNSLMKISPQRIGEELAPYSLSIGKFSGRGETVYHPGNPSAGNFVFVLEGAFEVDGRLLHARDGLALYETEEIEMEALSRDAVVLLIELPVILPVG